MEKYYYTQHAGPSLFKECIPDVISLIRNEMPPGINYNPHTHHCPEITLILEGTSEHLINGRNYTATTGDLIILNAGSVHAEYSLSETPVQIYSIEFDHVSLQGLSEGEIISPDASAVIHTGGFFDPVLRIYEELSLDRMLTDPRCYPLVQQTAARLFSVIHLVLMPEQGFEKQEISDLTSQIRAYIDAHYAEEISLDDLSKRFFVSHYHIVHQLKKDIGISPISYQINRRIGEAQRLLLFTDKPINEIAEEVGYVNYDYFSRLFAKKLGMSPTEYRSVYHQTGT